ncbi:hypothetical protein FB451DRAFT_1164917 [Mycena latifolia]|nr:hypothetical protein FB451DRAFT_1164917 [Mycena latifolia]
MDLAWCMFKHAQDACCLITNAYLYFLLLTSTFSLYASYNTQHRLLIKSQISFLCDSLAFPTSGTDEKLQVIVATPEVPRFSGIIKLKIIMAAQYCTINHSRRNIYEEIHKAGYEPLDYICFYHPRPTAMYIQQTEEKGGGRYHKTQVALVPHQIGMDSDESQEVTILLLVETLERLVLLAKTLLSSTSRRRCIMCAGTRTSMMGGPAPVTSPAPPQDYYLTGEVPKSKSLFSPNASNACKQIHTQVVPVELVYRVKGWFLRNLLADLSTAGLFLGGFVMVHVRNTPKIRGIP